MSKMKLKGCARCGGDLLPDREDRTGASYACLQCGAELSLGRAPRTLSGAHAARTRALVPAMQAPLVAAR